MIDLSAKHRRMLWFRLDIIIGLLGLILICAAIIAGSMLAWESRYQEIRSRLDSMRPENPSQILRQR